MDIIRNIIRLSYELSYDSSYYFHTDFIQELYGEIVEIPPIVDLLAD